MLRLLYCFNLSIDFHLNYSSNWGPLTGNIVDGTNGDVAVDHYHRYLVNFLSFENLRSSTVANYGGSTSGG